MMPLFRKYHSLFIGWYVTVCIAIQVQSDTIPDCVHSGKSISYLEVAMEMMKKAKENYPMCPTPSIESVPVRPLDCSDVQRASSKQSGLYRVWPQSRVSGDSPLEVYCDMDTDGGGWTVIQRRGNYSREKDYFFKDWVEYKTGFGNKEKDFWLGNDAIFALSNQRAVSLRFDLKAVDGEKKFALYDSFWIDDERNKYRLHIGDYSGDAGDSMIPTHENQKFSTKDQDNDNNKDQDCAQVYKGGWWYQACHHANLNGLDLRGKHESFADGIEWHSWKGYHESLDTTEMKLRPKNFRKKPAEMKLETPRF